MLESGKSQYFNCTGTTKYILRNLDAYVLEL